MKKSDIVKMIVEDILIYHYEKVEEQAYDILRVLEKNDIIQYDYDGEDSLTLEEYKDVYNKGYINE